MKKKRFNESQIVKILQEGEAGFSVGELARKYGIGGRSECTLGPQFLYFLQYEE